MFLGHFSIGVAAKPFLPQVHIGVLLLATQLLDVMVILLIPWGIEGIAAGSKPLDYGGIIAKVPISHSLPVTLLMSVGAGLIATRYWKSRKTGFIVGALVMSHWVLDVMVHHHDMPWLPYNWGGFEHIGFAWYENPALALSLELIMIFAALAFAYVGVYRKGQNSRHAMHWYCMLVFVAVTLIIHINQLPNHNNIELLANRFGGMFL